MEAESRRDRAQHPTWGVDTDLVFGLFSVQREAGHRPSIRLVVRTRRAVCGPHDRKGPALPLLPGCRVGRCGVGVIGLAHEDGEASSGRPTSARVGALGRCKQVQGVVPVCVGPQWAGRAGGRVEGRVGRREKTVLAGPAAQKAVRRPLESPVDIAPAVLWVGRAGIAGRYRRHGAAGRAADLEGDDVLKNWRQVKKVGRLAPWEGGFFHS